MLVLFVLSGGPGPAQLQIRGSGSATSRRLPLSSHIVSCQHAFEIACCCESDLQAIDFAWSHCLTSRCICQRGRWTGWKPCSSRRRAATLSLVCSWRPLTEITGVNSSQCARAPLRMDEASPTTAPERSERSKASCVSPRWWNSADYPSNSTARSTTCIASDRCSRALKCTQCLGCSFDQA